MRTDFIFVIGQIAEVYKKGFMTWDIKDVIRVFRCFYDYYQYCFRTDHPKLRTKTIEGIMYKLDQNQVAYSDDYINYYIPLYFQTKFREACDYSMSHFMSEGVQDLLLTRSVTESIYTEWDEKNHTVVGLE